MRTDECGAGKTDFFLTKIRYSAGYETEWVGEWVVSVMVSLEANGQWKVKQFLLADGAEEGPSWEAYRSAANAEIPRVLWY